MYLKTQFDWFTSGLFWRTFLFLVFAIFISLVTWIASFQITEEKPRDQQLASQLLSIITITRAALVHSAPEKRQELLFELASDDGIRIYALEDTDIIDPASTEIFSLGLQQIVRKKLGPDTIFSQRVNGINGSWVSFKIDGDNYWIVLDRDRFIADSNLRLISWSALVLLMSILAAIIITRLINQPLTSLSQAARAISEGRPFRPLPETGIAEIRATNKNFNQMAQELERNESDRTIILAGISHDLRTPLTRLQLEIELTYLPPETRVGMQTDIDQMDAIIGQFLDFARPADDTRFMPFDLSNLLETIVESAQRLPDIKMQHSIAPQMYVNGNAVEISRLINNLIENARRYGKTAGESFAQINLICQHQQRNKINYVVLQFSDKGPGIPEKDTEHLLRPFTRMDNARSQISGAGLGLAIVQRIVQQHHATMQLTNRDGLFIEICFQSLFTI